MMNPVHVGGNGLMHLLKPLWETMSSILRFCIPNRNCCHVCFPYFHHQEIKKSTTII